MNNYGIIPRALYILILSNNSMELVYYTIFIFMMETLSKRDINSFVLNCTASKLPEHGSVPGNLVLDPVHFSRRIEISQNKVMSHLQMPPIWEL